MPDVTFYHPDLSDPGPYLTIPTGMDAIEWGYSLNAATFPTYGGEVVQILSVFVSELTVQGTLSHYRQMDRVYRYFAQYLQVASQGKTGTDESFNQTPMIMTYPERNWQFKIIITSLPGFRYDREVVAPQWRIGAHIIDDSEDLHDIKEFIKAQALERFLEADDDDFALEGKIGFRAENPFSSPNTIFGESFSFSKAKKLIDAGQDQYDKIIESYLDSDLDQLYQESASRPTGDQGQDATDQGRVRRARERNE